MNLERAIPGDSQDHKGFDDPRGFLILKQVS